MPGDVEVQDASPVMTDYEKAIEQVEGDSGDRKEVHGGQGFAVIVKKRKPTLSRFRISGCTAHPAAEECSKPEQKELEHGARVIADRILSRIPMLFIFKAGQNCGKAQCLRERVSVPVRRASQQNNGRRSGVLRDCRTSQEHAHFLQASIGLTDSLGNFSGNSIRTIKVLA